MTKKKVIIVGAGTIGLHCALFLTQEGHEVEILEALPEQDESACSYGNCGFIVPSHFTPLASPAMLRSGLRMMFDPKSAFCLPAFSAVKNLPWFFNFVRAANPKRAETAAPLLFQLNIASRKLYAELENKFHPGAGYAQNGLLMASVTQKGFDEEISLAKIADRLGMNTRIITDMELGKTYPGLDIRLSGAVWYESDAQIRPEKHMRWLKKWLTAHGVTIRYQEKVEEIRHSNHTIAAVHTATGSYRADEFVIASGVRSAGLAQKVNIRLPVIAGKGYCINLPYPENKFRVPLILTEAKVAVSPYEDGIRLGSGMEFNGKVGHIRKLRVKAMLERTGTALPFLRIPDISQIPVLEYIRPVSPDGLPFLGRTAQYTNLLFSTGHAMMGMSLGPVSGKMISNMISGKDAGFRLSLLNPDRYST